MKTPDMVNPRQEGHSAYRVEHLPALDVVLNLEHPDQRRVQFLLDFLKRYVNDKTGKEKLFDFDLINEGSQFVDEEGEQLFYFKPKHKLQGNIDFVLGRTSKDPLDQTPLSHVDNRGRYALESVLSEISLSRKIKQIISSEKAQELARQYGFESFIFSEPIGAFINRESHNKFLVYRHIMDGDFLNEDFKLPFLVTKLRHIFFNNGINPNDLRSDQFMISEKDGKYTLILIDVEMYTQKSSIDSPRIGKPSH